MEEEIRTIYDKYLIEFDYYLTLKDRKNEYLYDLLDKYSKLKNSTPILEVKVFIAKLILIIGNIILFNTMNRINGIGYEEPENFTF
jgi:hypothetical protein